MDQLSQALNLGPQPMTSAYSRLHGRTLKNISRKNRLYLYGVYTLSEFSEAVRDGSEACQGRKPPLWRRSRRRADKPNSYRSRLPFLRFGQKTASTVRKIYFIVRNGQSRTINKPKTNTLWEWPPADCMITSLANIKTLCQRPSGCPRARRSVSTRPSLYPALRNNLKRLPWSTLVDKTARQIER